jgi:hypothetical protein
MQTLTLASSTQDNLFGLSEIMIPVTEEDLKLIRQLENHGQDGRSMAFLNTLLKLKLGDNLFVFAYKGIQQFYVTSVEHTDAFEKLKKSFFNRLMIYLKDAEEKSPDTFLTVAGNIIGYNDRKAISALSPGDYSKLNCCLRKIINLPLHCNLSNAVNKISQGFNSNSNIDLGNLAMMLIANMSGIREDLVSVGMKNVDITATDSQFIDFLLSQEAASAYSTVEKQ